jgi:hypothetical protein
MTEEVGRVDELVRTRERPEGGKFRSLRTQQRAYVNRKSSVIARSCGVGRPTPLY